MSVEVWGQLAKSQEDSETIEEAIDRLIDEHNDNPTAHSSANQAIAVHRANDILDHKVGSVLADKWTMSELDFSTTFDILDIFQTHADPYSQYPGVHIEPSAAGDANYGLVGISLEDRSISIDFGKDFLFQIAFSGDIYETGSLQINFGFTPTNFTKKGVGLEVNNSNVRFYATDIDGNNPVYLNWPTFSGVTPYIIRIQNVASEGKVYVYINGELLGTITLPEADMVDVGHIVFASKKSGASGGTLEIYNLFFSLAL